MVTSTSLTLNWNPPGFDKVNGVIIYYQIIVIEVETGYTYNYTSYSTTLSLTQLHPAYTYQCSIAAYTVALGPYSEPFNVTTAEDGR